MKKIIGEGTTQRQPELVGYTYYSMPGSLDYWCEDLYLKRTEDILFMGKVAYE